MVYNSKDNVWHGTNAERLADTKIIAMPTAKVYEYDTGNIYVTDGLNWSSKLVKVGLETSLSKDYDSIDIGKMSNGGTILALNAAVVTTTSAEISVGAAGFKNIAIEITGGSFTSGNFAITIVGSAISGGNFSAINTRKEDGTYVPITIPAISTNATFQYIIPNIGINFIKLTGTRTTDGTLTVRVTPFN